MALYRMSPTRLTVREARRRKKLLVVGHCPDHPDDPDNPHDPDDPDDPDDPTNTNDPIDPTNLEELEHLQDPDNHVKCNNEDGPYKLRAIGQS
jgi:hypothetical protein